MHKRMLLDDALAGGAACRDPLVNGTSILNEKGRVLHDSDMITMSATALQFRDN